MADWIPNERRKSPIQKCVALPESCRGNVSSQCFCAARTSGRSGCIIEVERSEKFPQVRRSPIQFTQMGIHPLSLRKTAICPWQSRASPETPFLTTVRLTLFSPGAGGHERLKHSDEMESEKGTGTRGTTDGEAHFLWDSRAQACSDHGFWPFFVPMGERSMMQLQWKNS